MCKPPAYTRIYAESPNFSSYEQIGLKFKLYSAEVLFNQGLSYLRMNQTDQGMRLLDQARKEKEIPEHDVIDEALAAFGRDFTVFSVPTGMRMYRFTRFTEKHIIDSRFVFFSLSTK